MKHQVTYLPSAKRFLQELEESKLKIEVKDFPLKCSVEFMLTFLSDDWKDWIHMQSKEQSSVLSRLSHSAASLMFDTRGACLRRPWNSIEEDTCRVEVSCICAGFVVVVYIRFRQ